jgi:hypothetical protein
MELICSAAIIALGIVIAAVFSAWFKSRYHMKPKLAFATATIVGKTEESESMQFTTQLFEDESPLIWKGKINQLLEMREERLGFQNTRIAEIHKQQMQALEEEKAKILAEDQAKKPTLVK